MYIGCNQEYIILCTLDYVMFYYLPLNKDIDYIHITSTIIKYVSSLVLNSRDWYEIVWLPQILCFKNHPCNRLYLKKLPEMHIEAIGYYTASLQPLVRL